MLKILNQTYLLTSSYDPLLRPAAFTSAPST